jgi:hypothetical protein
VKNVQHVVLKTEKNDKHACGDKERFKYGNSVKYLTKHFNRYHFELFQFYFYKHS